MFSELGFMFLKICCDTTNQHCFTLTDFEWICVGHHDTQANTNNVNKTWALLQTTTGKYEANIILMRKW